ncbi:hypothetical protein D3C86_2265060 [compost metagenome]
MADPRMNNMGEDMMPFDGKRMIYGGFKSMVEVSGSKKSKSGSKSKDKAAKKAKKH